MRMSHKLLWAGCCAIGLAITSAALAKVYTDTFQGLIHPNHASAHVPRSARAAVPGPHKAVKVGAVTITPFFTTGVNEFEDAETAIITALTGWMLWSQLRH